MKDEGSGLWQEAKWNRDTGSNVVKPDGLTMSQEDMELLVKNTYYVMMSRPRKKLGIWFRNEVTKKQVLEVLGPEIDGLREEQTWKD